VERRLECIERTSSAAFALLSPETADFKQQLLALYRARQIRWAFWRSLSRVETRVKDSSHNRKYAWF